MVDVSAFRPINLAQLYQSADAAVGQALQTNLLTMQASKMRQEYDEEDQLRTLARTSTTTDASGTPSFDLKSFTKGAYGVNPMKAIGFEKAAADAAKSALDRENTQGQIDERRMKLAADRLKAQNEASTVPFLKYKELLDSGVPDAQARAQVQPLHDTAMRNLIDSGLFPPEQLQKMKMLQKPEFDPVLAEAGMRHVLGAKDQLAEYWNRKNFGQKEKQHEDTLKVQIRGQNITLRGQDLTDRRAREQLDQQGLEVKDNEDGTYSVIHKATKTAYPVLDQNGQPLKNAKGAGTEGERISSGFASRMAAAEDILTNLTTGAQTPGLAESVTQNIPLTGEVIANSWFRGENRQKALQAQRDWVRAKLRKESGAVIGPKEMADEIITYFPQIGDDAATVEQKTDARKRATEGMVQSAGRAYKPGGGAGRPGDAGKPGGAAAAGVTVDTPSGAFTFPSQAAADKFKREAGIN